MPPVPPSPEAVHRQSMREGVLVGVVTLLIAWGALAIVYQQTRHALLGNVRARLEDLAAVGAGGMDATLHAMIATESQVGSDSYRSAMDPLLRLRAAAPDIFYAYTTVLRGDEVVFVLDTSYYLKNAGDETEVALAGEVYDDAADELKAAWRTDRVVSSEEPYTDKWGTFLSAYSPFHDSSGQVAGIVGVDLSLARYNTLLRPVEWGFGASFGLSLLAAGLVGWATRRAQLRRALVSVALVEARNHAEKQADIARKADRAKSTFLATMSHEIRTPMNGVLGMAEILEDTELSRDQRDYVRVIRGSSESLLTVLNDILDYSKIEAGGVELKLQDMSLRPCLSQVVELYAVQASSKGLKLEVEWLVARAQGIRADGGRVRQVLNNLLSNAVKFTNQGGVRVRVEDASENAERRLAVRVIDSGPGVEADKLNLLFRPFSQVDGSSTRKQGGSGLGLVISRRLAEMMGGSLTVESRVGEGCTFTLILPSVEVAEVEEKAKPVSTEQSSLTVLVGEDIEGNRRVVDLLLRRLGVKAVFAVDGTEVVRRWRELRPDVVFMDVQMPGVDGCEATRLIRAECASTQRPWIVALTAGVLSDEREAALAAGMNDFITKPVTGKMLTDALKRARIAINGGA